MPRRRNWMEGGKPKASKVKVKSMFEHVQGDTIRRLLPKDLPQGCCVLSEDGRPCTYMLTHIVMKITQAIWSGDDQPNIIIEGYCKKHRPKKVDGAMLELPDRIKKVVNGGRQVRARIRRMEKAMYLNVIPSGGSLRHSTERFTMGDSQWVQNVSTLCGKVLKKAYVPTPGEARDDYPDECGKCAAARSVVPEK
jgi:hypothetical protein